MADLGYMTDRSQVQLLPLTRETVGTLLGWYRQLHEPLHLQLPFDAVPEVLAAHAEEAVAFLTEQTTVRMVVLNDSPIGWWEATGSEQELVQGWTLGTSHVERLIRAWSLKRFLAEHTPCDAILEAVAPIRCRDLLESFTLVGFRPDSVRLPGDAETDRGLVFLQRSPERARCIPEDMLDHALDVR